MALVVGKSHPKQQGAEDRTEDYQFRENYSLEESVLVE